MDCAASISIAFVLADYVLYARHLVYGGGPAFSTAEVLRRGLSVALGGPDAGVWALASAVYAVCLIAVGLDLLQRERNDEAIFFLTALVLARCRAVCLSRAVSRGRYFFVLLPFVWLLAARALAHGLSSSPAGRVIVPALVTASVLGNGAHVVTMLRDGRGDYARAVSTMSALTPGQDIVVASDQDFSNRLILDYYGENISPHQRLTYVSAASEGSRAPQWFISSHLRHARRDSANPRDNAGGGDLQPGTVVPVRRLVGLQLVSVPTARAAAGVKVSPGRPRPARRGRPYFDGIPARSSRSR